MKILQIENRDTAGVILAHKRLAFRLCIGSGYAARVFMIIHKVCLCDFLRAC